MAKGGSAALPGHPAGPARHRPLQPHHISISVAQRRCTCAGRIPDAFQVREQLSPADCVNIRRSRDTSNYAFIIYSLPSEHQIEATQWSTLKRLLDARALRSCAPLCLHIEPAWRWLPTQLGLRNGSTAAQWWHAEIALLARKIGSDLTVLLVIANKNKCGTGKIWHCDVQGGQHSEGCRGSAHGACTTRCTGGWPMDSPRPILWRFLCGEFHGLLFMHYLSIPLIPAGTWCDVGTRVNL